MRKYDIKTSPLYNLSNKKKLKEILHLQNNPKAIKYVLKNKKFYYNEFSIKQNNNKKREIQAPQDVLKFMQGKLNTLLLRIKTPDFLFSSKKSNIQNAEYHKENPFFLSTDIEHFYQNVSELKVYDMFIKKFCMSKDIAYILKELVFFYDKKMNRTVLPTGSPCSQLIAYWTYEKTFNDVNDYCIKNGLKFSLYVDDINISSSKIIKSHALRNIKNRLEYIGLNLKRDKTKFYGSKEEKKVTGCAITRKHNINIPKEKRQEINNLIKKENIEKIIKTKNIKALNSIIGKISYYQRIVPNYQNRIYKKLIEIKKSME